MISLTGALVGVGITFAGLALSVLILAVKIGRLVGAMQTEMRQNGRDIKNLWDHQRVQDDKIDTCEKIIPEMRTDIKWIRRTMETEA